MPRLHDCLLSGNAHKVRLPLTQLGLPFDLARHTAIRRWLDHVVRQRGHIPITRG